MAITDGLARRDARIGADRIDDEALGKRNVPPFGGGTQEPF
jgi:hypothetical protein